LTLLGNHLGWGLLSRAAILGSLLLFGVLGAALLGVANFEAVARAPWLGLPKLFLFGGPFLGWELVGAALFAVGVGYIGSMAEAIGDYAGTCAVSGVTYRVSHMNRGITLEGIASAVGPLFGALPLTTYSQNTGVIATTKVASRRVVQVAAVLLLAYGLCPKIGALLVVIPRPIVGAVFLVICGMIATAGLRLIGSGAKDDRTFLTTAVTLSLALTLPLVVPTSSEWFKSLPALAKLMLTNSVVIAVTLGVGLNAVLGTALATHSAPTQ
jgi:xanthine/uracil permease